MVIRAVSGTGMGHVGSGRHVQVCAGEKMYV